MHRSVDAPGAWSADDARPDRPIVVGIGASAGGLEALRDMLSPARAPTGMAFVVVQHLDPNHESMLAQLLDRHTTLNVLQSEGGEKVAADTVYIIPPGHGLAIHGGVLELTEFTQPRGLRRPIDDFFISLASDQQANAACVILSGTGADGSTGLRAIKEHGGVCVVQQPESARYDGMPTSAVGTGMVDFVKHSAEILECLAGYFSRRSGDVPTADTDLLSDQVDELCRILRAAVGHDFSGYKRSTLLRRVERRMHVLGLTSGRAYLGRIRTDSRECEALFRDLLINVTRFFRDARAFEILQRDAIMPLLRDRQPDEDIRVWIPGCSSGEEAYSIAMLFADSARQLGVPAAVQIFATDIDEQMLQIARDGSYPAAALADIPPPFRERYTVPHAERFTISSDIRDLIRFSSHSLIKDPPFSRIDLLSCRNLLIYFDERLQQSVMPLLHYAVRPGGYLFLGPSESVGRFEHLFPLIEQQARLFERSPGAPTYPIDLPGGGRAADLPRPRTEPRGRLRDAADEGAAVRRMMERYAPPSMVLDHDGGIVAAYGRLSRYFEFPVSRTGGSSAISLARPGLREAIGPLLRQCRDSRRRVVARAVEVRTEHGVQTVEVLCDPLADGTMLMVFRDSAPFRLSEDDDLVEMAHGDDHLEALEDELRLTRHRLRSTVEELETANEELKSSNEEMMSMNEELQSTNEELSTVNDELKSKVDQLTVANADLRNFFESTNLAVVVLDRQLRVRSYTEAATALFPLQPADRGRPLADVASRIDGADYLEDARLVAEGGEPVQRRVNSRDGSRTLALRVLPYRSQTGSVEGATIVLTDITEALTLERQLSSERERLDLAILAGGIGVWEFNPARSELRLDATGQRLLGVDAEVVELERLLARVHEEDRAAVAEALATAAAGRTELECRFRIGEPGDEVHWIKNFGRLTRTADGLRLVGVSIDVTPEFALAETRDLMLREMNHRVKNLFAIISGMISAGARHHDQVRPFAADMRERIAALGRAHSLASPAGVQEAIDLAELVRSTLQPYADHAEISIAGPRVVVARRLLSSLALVLHEWATNAVKYGALGQEQGQLRVGWRVADGRLIVEWVERGGNPVTEASGSGFGTLLVETSARQLQAEFTRDMAPGQLRLELSMPSEVVIDV